LPNKNLKVEDGFEILQTPLTSGKRPDRFVFISLLDLWCRHQEFNKAIQIKDVYDSHNLIPDETSFGYLARSSFETLNVDTALFLFRPWREGKAPSYLNRNVLNCKALIKVFSFANLIDEAFEVFNLLDNPSSLSLSFSHLRDFFFFFFFF
jgi:hypothetical protein